MDDSLAEVIRLLRLAQAGQPEQALVQAEGNLDGEESLGMLYVSAVALHCIGDHEAAAAAADQMLGLAADNAGWQSIALSFRATQHMLLSELIPQAFDLETTLQDLAQAEAILSQEVTDGFVLASAHTGLGNGYHAMRLYELALPHYEAALEASLTHSAEIALMSAVTSELNLAQLHLNWAVELHRVRETDRAWDKKATAARHAELAHEYASTEDSIPFAATAALLAACADTTGVPDEVVERIRQGIHEVDEHGLRENRAFALPFLAWALVRADRLSEATEVADEACDALPANATWMLISAAYHTRAALLARSGNDAARASLAYGDQLAKTMWQERLRTLHNARSVQVLERVTLERDRVNILAHTDALTGVGNRRAFDVRVAEWGNTTEPPDLAMIVIDVDRLKAVNDAGGHEAGDLTLQAVASALSGQVRSTDLVARVGGDEFVAVVEGMDGSAAAALATRMIDAVSAALGSSVSVSVGVATGSASEAGTALLRAADRAMYAAKRANRIAVTDAAELAAQDQLTDDDRLVAEDPFADDDDLAVEGHSLTA